MDPVKITGMVRAGGVNVSKMAARTRIEILLDAGQSLQIAQLIELMEQGIICKIGIAGDKGTSLDIIAAIWKIRTTIDGGMTLVFEMDKGNAVNAVRLSESAVMLETLELTVEGDKENGIHTRKNGQSQWSPQKREYPN
jgi:hypothetical protein